MACVNDHIFAPRSARELRVGVPLLVSAAVQQRLPASFLTRQVGTIELRGISEPVMLYELCSESTGGTPTVIVDG
jgi:class 3 adenylate cyclase